LHERARLRVALREGGLSTAGGGQLAIASTISVQVSFDMQVIKMATTTDPFEDP